MSEQSASGWRDQAAVRATGDAVVADETTLASGIGITPETPETPEASRPTSNGQPGAVEQGSQPTAKPGRTSGVIRAVRARVADAGDRLEQARERSPAVGIGFEVFERDRSKVGVLLGCAIAYRMFIVLVPLAFLPIAVLGIIRGINNRTPERIVDHVGLVGFAAKSMVTGSNDTHRSAVLLLIIVLYALWKASRGAVKTFRLVSGAIWGIPVPKLRRSWRGPLGLLAILAAGFIMIGVASWARGHLGAFGMLITICTLAGWYGLWLVAELWLPHPKEVTVRELIPGAILMALGLEALHLLVVFYISREVSHASATYGALGVAVTLLGVFYLLGRLVVATAALNAALVDRAAARAAAGPASPAS